jgi:flavin-dependent dehydrogenase
MIDDVLIVGAGPAGAVAATVLARAGARVRLIDRATFPRDKLCGDTLNPGTLNALRRLGLAKLVDDAGWRIEGMRLTGPRGVGVEGLYPRGLYGRSILRRDLDWILLQHAIGAGVQFDPGVCARAPIVAEIGGFKKIEGVVVGVNGATHEVRAPVTIAADGRRSTIAFALKLARHPARPRRWAVGAYYENVQGLTTLGEMHIRKGRYIGVAPVPGGATNVCLVVEKEKGKRFDVVNGKTDPFFQSLLTAEIARDPHLRDRFAGARLLGPPVVLGPLAVDVSPHQLDGLLLAGDAAGFIDPMTGDGLRFAVRGGVLAAEAAIDALARGWEGVHERLEAKRRLEFAFKWRFNRALRALVASPAAVEASSLAARVAPAAFSRVIATAGDCRKAALEYPPGFL